MQAGMLCLHCDVDFGRKAEKVFCPEHELCLIFFFVCLYICLVLIGENISIFGLSKETYAE